MSLLLGIDYGGTNSKLVLQRGGEVLRADVVPTAQGASSLRVLADEVDAFLGGDRIDAFGITVAGIVDAATGVVRVSANMPWLASVAPSEVLGESLHAPGVAVHDGAAAATAEALLGAGRGHDDVFVLALGTGVAGAHVVQGTVRRGAHGAAGELGHVATGRGELCSCGQRGCLETEIGGARLARRWDESGASSVRDLVAAADRGDARAIGILDTATTALAQALLGLVAVVDPGMVVIGGGLSGSPAWIVDPTVRKVAECATFHALPVFRVAELGLWAGARGGALAAARIAGAAAPVV